MNWEAIGALGQVLGAVAVIATLLYIAREVRQNGRSLSISAMRDTTAQWNHWSEIIATSTDLAEIVSKGNKSSDTLSESESLRYGTYVQSFFDNVDSYRLLTSAATCTASSFFRRNLNNGMLAAVHGTRTRYRPV